MFIGHFALGFAAKRATPKVSLGLLFVAAQLADLLWPLFVAAGIEQVRIDPGNTAFTPLDFVSYPYSHSLAMLVVWGLLLGGLYRFRSGDSRGFIILPTLVVSHWVLDFLTHRPDMPLYPGGLKLGVGLWNSVPGTLLVEFALFAAGLFLYLRATQAHDRVGRWALAAMCVFLVAAYLGALSGPPPSISAIWIVTLTGGAVVLGWSTWIDMHRHVRSL